MEFVLEVVAKVEAAKMDDPSQVQYTVQGRLWVEHEGSGPSNEPQLMAVVMPYDLWNVLSLGQVIRYPMAS